MLQGIEHSLGSKDISSSIYKSITNDINNISVDYSFNFLNGMGRIYLIGMDETNTKERFVIGMNDGWLALNAKPIIYLYKTDGQLDTSHSWNVPDTSLSTTTNSGGLSIVLTFLLKIGQLTCK